MLGKKREKKEEKGERKTNQGEESKQHPVLKGEKNIYFPSICIWYTGKKPF